jgi:hypothetical protein
MNHRIAVAGLALGLFLCSPRRAAAQNQYVGMQAVAPTTAPHLTAKFIDAEKKARMKSATVSVDVKGIKLVDPDSVGGKPYPGQGHLHYRLDDGPVIATTATKLSFHGLTSGPHVLTVLLAGNDHTPLGPSATLNVVVP